tara:strand:+ start:70 stop:303 length:234 start_codon:yes stop_codon:yes gene_type:complete
MNIKPIAPNQTEIHLNNGTLVLVSYQTPVAAFDAEKSKWIRSAEKYSVTTSKHVNKWLSGLNTTTVPQSEIDALMEV